MLASLGRGALSGLVAGVLVAAFGYLLAEPLMDRAVDLEAARSTSQGTETFTRFQQHVGFGVAAVFVGLAFGVLYGVLHRLLDALEPSADAWGRSLRLGAAAFFGVSLVPFLRYPANPPGTGDSGTIGQRTGTWEASIVIGVVGAVLAALIARGLRDRGVRRSYRQLAVTAVLLATIALTFVLPGNTDALDVPVTLLWDFRLLSLASLALLWGAMAVTFGLLSERASRVPEDTRELAAA